MQYLLKVLKPRNKYTKSAILIATKHIKTAIVIATNTEEAYFAVL